MDILIKPMESDAEIEGKAYVHWKAWQEAYQGLIDPAYLERLTLDKCVKAAFQWTENILVAKENDRVIGFVGYGACREKDLPEAGEVFALYILSEYYGKKAGYALMQAALGRLSEYRRVAVWVLQGNERAARFYEKCGFRFDGARQPVMLGRENTMLRMVLARDGQGG